MATNSTTDSNEQVKAVLLELIRTVDGDAQEAFKLIDFYKEKDQPDGIKMWLGDNIKKHFLTGVGRIELDVPAEKLNVYKLLKGSTDAPIIATLGGNEAIRSCLAYMAQLIRNQPKGQQGVLLTNGWANIFYAEDDNGVLWAVFCYWSSDSRSWRVGAFPVTRPREWNAGNRVFSTAVLVA